MLKRKLLCLVLLTISFLSLNFVKAKSTELELIGKVIYLDPGHGGLDPGAMYKDLKESTFTLAISQKVKEVLEASGAIVYMTRYDDYDLSVNYAQNRKRSDLSRRANVINKSGCNLYLSIHLNSNVSATWKGAQVYYNDINEKNKELASIFQDQFKIDLKTNRKYKKDTNMYMYRRIKQPGVLLEVGFLSNPNERYLLKQDSYQKKIANSIKKAVITYFTS